MAQFIPKKAIQITNTPAGNIAAINVQAAINELDTEKFINNVSASDRVLGRVSSGAGVIEEIITTGSGNVVRAISPTISSPIITNIAPAADFTITQNSVIPFTSVNAGAVVNTLYLKEGNVGIGTTNPGYKLEVRGTDQVAYFGNGLSEGEERTIGIADNGVRLVAVRDVGTGGRNDLQIRAWYAGINDIARFTGAGNVGIGTTSFGTSAAKVVALGTGTAPSTSPVDIFQMYSADIVVGNAAPHFRTENGGIIKLYKYVDARIDDTPNSGDATTDGIIASIQAALQANGLMAAA